MDWKAYEEKLRELDIEIEDIFKRLDENGSSRRFDVISWKCMMVEENTEAFGKRG